MYQNRVGRPSSTPPKPTFDVAVPFLGVLMFRCNHAMSMALQRFIDDVEDVENEIIAFKEAFRDPTENGAFVYKDGPSFVVNRSFKGVIQGQMNQDMRELLSNFIGDVEGGVDKIVWAFKLALENPGQSPGRHVNSNGGFKRRRVVGPGANYDYDGNANEGSNEYNDDNQLDHDGPDCEEESNEQAPPQPTE